MLAALQILSDLKDGGVQGWVYWQVRNLSCMLDTHLVSGVLDP